MAANIYDVAKFFLAHVDGITPLKLQKLCFYAQAWYAAKTGRPLVNTVFEAWKNGPVAKELYQEYRHYGGSQINPAEADGFDPVMTFEVDQLDVLSDVLSVYGNKSAFELSNETHEEDPWANAYQPNMNNEITLESMIEYYGAKTDSPMNNFENLINDWQEELDAEANEGLVLSLSHDYMVQQAQQDFETAQEISQESLNKYLGMGEMRT